MSKKILVIAAHPDDEVLGCGGTIAKHTACGDEVGVLFIADGVGARNDQFEESKKARQDAARSALKTLNAKPLDFLDFPDNQLDTVPLLEIVKKIEGVIKEFSPEIVYTHHHGDLNIDHAITHRATMTACRPLPGRCVRQIFAYEVLSASEWAIGNNSFSPNYFVEISSYWEQKKQSLEAYSQEIPEFPHARSIEAVHALSIIRGASVGKHACEAFQLVRSIND